MTEYLTVPVTLAKQALREIPQYRNTANASAFVVGDTPYAPGQLVHLGFVGVHRDGLWYGYYRFVPASPKTGDVHLMEFADLLDFSADKEVDDGCDA